MNKMDIKNFASVNCLRNLRDTVVTSDLPAECDNINRVCQILRRTTFLQQLICYHIDLL